jgi:transposase
VRTGRPTKLTALFDVREVDGRRVERTIGEALCDFVRLGHFMATACALVGINSDTAREWIRTGRRAVDRLDAGARRRDLSAHERRCSDFSVTVATALAEAEHRDVRRLAALAAGGLPQVTVVEEHELDGDGQERLVKRTTRATETLPDAAPLRWRLERRFPDRWGRRVELDVDLADDDADEFGEDPIEAAKRRLLDRARRLTEGQAALESIGELDVLDAEIVDEQPPDLS